MIFRKVVYYFLSCTWGCLMTLFGAFVALGLLCTGHKPKRHAGSWYFEIGENWGGFEAGLVFVCNKGSSRSLRDHEFGHNIQNCIFGPLTPFLISIPSMIRYWYRELKYNRKGLIPPTLYDSIWFEGQASKFGRIFREKW